MAANEPKDIAQIFREGTLIDAAMNAAVREAVRQHKEKGLPLVVWRGGKTVLISPEEAEREQESQSHKENLEKGGFAP